MAELLKNAWQGWQAFTNAGKLPAALLISLLFLWIYYKRVKRKEFLIYTTVVTICCILPVTAAVLVLYQTKLYDYKWIWSIVPMTAAVSYAGTLFMMEFLQETTGGDRKRQAAAGLLLTAALLFCGGIGGSGDEYGSREERQQAEEILAELQERLQGKKICLWAPREILTYARAYDGEIQLLYGRDMWDSDLRAYSYDVYSGGLEDMYRWMEAPPGEENVPDSYCAETAVSAEVNCILLPEDKLPETIDCFEEMLGVRAEKSGNYYLLIR